MENTFIPYVIAWSGLLMVVIILAIVRAKMATAEDDALKLTDGEVGAIMTQQHVADQLSTVEAFGKWLTVLLLISGLTLVGSYGWALFNSTEMFAK